MTAFHPKGPVTVYPNNDRRFNCDEKDCKRTADLNVKLGSHPLRHEQRMSVMKPPDPKLPFSLDDFGGCWPMKAEIAPLEKRRPPFDGQFDEEDINTVRQAFSGRSVTIDGVGNMTVHTSTYRSDTRCWWP